MIIREVIPLEGGFIRVVAEDGRAGTVDLGCYLDSTAFAPLKNREEFARLRNGKYFIEWVCGADLSADTLEARMKWMTSGEGELRVADDSAQYKTGRQSNPE